MNNALNISDAYGTYWLSRAILGETLRNGGYTHRLTGRYVVGIENNAFDSSDVGAILSFIDRLLDGQANFGTWHDKETGLIYVDRIVCLDNKQLALELAKHYGQKAIFDAETGREIYVK